MVPNDLPYPRKPITIEYDKDNNIWTARNLGWLLTSDQTKLLIKELKRYAKTGKDIDECNALNQIETQLEQEVRLCRNEWELMDWEEKRIDYLHSFPKGHPVFLALREMEKRLLEQNYGQRGKKKAMVSEGYIYIVRSGKYCKIGKAKQPGPRLGEYTLLPQECTVLMCEKVGDYTAAERQLHLAFSDKRRRGEWFALNNLDVAEAKKIIKPHLAA